MGKKVFWIFFVVVSLVSFMTIAYLQSSYFANKIKERLNPILTKKLKLKVEFENLSVKFFPPGFSLTKVQLQVLEKDNPLAIPESTKILADELGLTFRMIQEFSGNIIANLIYMRGAKVEVEIPASYDSVQRKRGSEDTLSNLESHLTKPIEIKVNEKLKLIIRQVEIKNTSLKLFSASKNFRLEIDKINSFSLRPDNSGLTIVSDLDSIVLKRTNFFESLDIFSSNFTVSKSSIRVNSLNFKKGFSSGHFQGQIKGSLKKLNSAKIDLNIVLRATSEELARYEKLFGNAEGKYELIGRLEGGVDYPSFSGKFSLKEFEHQGWSFDTLEGQAKASRDSVELTRVVLVKDDAKINIDKFKVDLKEKSLSGTTNLLFKKFSYKDLVAGFKNKAPNFETELNGKLGINYNIDFNKKIDLKKLNASLSFDLPYFNIKNKKPPVKKIIGIKNATVNGNVIWDQGILKIANTKVGLRTGEFDLFGTVKNSDIQLFAQSSIMDFNRELGAVADLPILGKGSIAFELTDEKDGLNILFDINSKDSKFLDIFFGDINAKILYADRKKAIEILSLDAKIKKSRFTGKGLVKIDDTEVLDISVKMDDVVPEDLYSAFEYQLRKISWIPNNVKGALDGQFNVTGAYTDVNRTLIVKGNVSGSKIFHRNELFQSMVASFEYSEGNYYLHSLNSKKYGSSIVGKLKLDNKNNIDYSVKVFGGKLKDINFLADYGFPLNGNLSIVGRGQGSLDNLDSELDINIKRTQMHTRALSDIDFKLRSKNRIIQSNAKYEGSSARLEVHLDESKKNTSKFDLVLQGNDFSYLLCFLNRKLCENRTTIFSPKGNLSLDWVGKNWNLADGTIDLDPFSIGEVGKILKVRNGINGRISKGKAEILDILITSKDTNLIIAPSGKIDGSQFETKINGKSNFRFVELFVPQLKNANGRLEMNVGISGSVDRMNMIGNVRLVENSFDLVQLGAQAKRLNGNLKLQGNRINFVDVSGLFGGGPFDLKGYCDLFLNRLPLFNLQFYLKNNRIKVFPVDFTEVEEAKFEFTGSNVPYLFSGNVELNRAVVRRSFDQDLEVRSIRSAKYLPPQSELIKKVYEVDIKVKSSGNVFVQNELLDAEFQGDLRIINNFDFPKITGSLELISGNLLFRNSTIVLDYLSIKMKDPDNFDPVFSLGGSTTVDRYKVTLFATGSVTDPKIVFTSNPSLAQEDILSLLAFGFTGSERKDVNQDNINAITYTEMGSLLLEQLKLKKNLQSKGVRLKVAPTISDNPAKLLQTDLGPSSTATPKVTVSKKITDKLEASAASTFGPTDKPERNFKLEYFLKDGISIQGVYDEEAGFEPGRVNKSTGADLRFKWEFK